MTKVSILGSGGIALSSAYDLRKSNYEVCIYTRSPKKINGKIIEINEKEELIGEVSDVKVTNNLKLALENAKYVIVTYPSFIFYDFAPTLEKNLEKDSIVCVFPGTGGVEFAFKNLIDKGITVVGLQRVPYIARVKEEGKIVKMSGKKEKLYLASIPIKYSDKICEDFENMFKIPCISLPNYLSVTFTPSNPILHTSRLYAMFNNKENNEFKDNILFYEEWDDFSSEILFKCDEELQTICNELKEIDLSNVVSLRTHYESNTPKELTEKIRSIKAFKGITSPLKKIGDTWKIDWDSRYFTADFPYGLAIIKSFADILNIKVKYIEKVLGWYLANNKEIKLFDLRNYNIKTKDDIIKYYMKED